MVVNTAAVGGVSTLLARITQEVRQLLQQQQQQQRQARTDIGPPAKQQRTAGTAVTTAAPATAARDGAGDAVCAQQLLWQLLSAYEAAAAAAGFSGPEGGLGWRLAVAHALHELPALHQPLLQRLLDGLQGARWCDEAPAQVRGASWACSSRWQRHTSACTCRVHGCICCVCACPCGGPPLATQALWLGSLAAVLAVSRRQQQLVLLPDARDSPVSQAPAAAPLFAWRCGASGAGAGGAGAGASVQGLELLQLLITHTRMDTLRQCACAASFFAGYLGCLRKTLGGWCAGAYATHRAQARHRCVCACVTPDTTGTCTLVHAGVHLRRVCARAGLEGFGDKASFTSSPLGTAVTQITPPPAAAAAAAAGGDATAASTGAQLLGFVPPEVVVLLQQLSGKLGGIARQQQLGEAEQAVAAGALQVSLLAKAIELCACVECAAQHARRCWASQPMHVLVLSRRSCDLSGLHARTQGAGSEVGVSRVRPAVTRASLERRV
jgi:hypothetical protein